MFTLTINKMLRHRPRPDLIDSGLSKYTLSGVWLGVDLRIDTKKISCVLKKLDNVYITVDNFSLGSS